MNTAAQFTEAEVANFFSIRLMEIEQAEEREVRKSPLFAWAVKQPEFKAKAKAKAESKAAGWCLRWTQDHDGTLRWGWLDKAELEEQAGHEHDPELALSFRLALAALNNPELKDRLRAVPKREYDEWVKLQNDVARKEMAELAEQKVIQLKDYRPEPMTQAKRTAYELRKAEQDLAELEAFQADDLQQAYEDEKQQIKMHHSKEKAPLIERISQLKRQLEQPEPEPATEPEPQPEQPEQPQNPASKRANQILSELLKSNDSELERLSKVPMLVDGLVPAQSVGMFYGESGSYKSFLMIDMGACVATGEPFAGCAIDSTGDVIYLAAEGGTGVRKRLRAWEQEHGKKADGVRILPLGLILDDQEERRLLVAALDELVRRTGRKIKMIILDTLSQTTQGDDNSNRDMAAYINACADLKEHFGCAVCFVHHTGKTGDGFRGAYALQANIDFQFCVKKVQPLYAELLHEKSKDTEQAKPKRFRMKSVELDGVLDYKGRPITTLVPAPLGMMQEAELVSTLTEREKLLMAELTAHVSGSGNLPCDRKALRDSFKDALMDAEADLDDEAARKAFARCLTSLSKRGFLRHTKDTVEKL